MRRRSEYWEMGVTAYYNRMVNIVALYCLLDGLVVFFTKASIVSERSLLVDCSSHSHFSNLAEWIPMKVTGRSAYLRSSSSSSGST